METETGTEICSRIIDAKCLYVPVATNVDVNTECVSGPSSGPVVTIEDVKEESEPIATIEDVKEESEPIGIIGKNGSGPEDTVAFIGDDGEIIGVKGPTEQTEDQKEIKNEVQKAIDSIMKDPGQISNIVNSIKGDKNVLKQVLDFIQKNPNLKSQAMNKVMGSAPTMQQLSRMPKKERDEILKKAKEARKQMAEINPLTNKAVIITNSRMAKDYAVSGEFPSGSKFCDGIVEELKDGIFYVYMPEEKRLNRRASQIVGKPTNGEIVIFRLDEQENLVDFTLNEFNTLFPRTSGGDSSSPSSSSSSSSSSSKSGRRR